MEGREIFKKLHQAGAQVLYVEAAANAIKYVELRGLSKLGISVKQAALPKTQLPDDAYDLVICLDVIADLPPEDFRLAVAELSRIVKSSGYVLCSTPIDIDSEDALERFSGLISTEFKIHEWKLSYHSLYLRLLDFLKAPKRFYKGWKEKDYLAKQLKSRGSFVPNVDSCE